MKSQRKTQRSTVVSKKHKRRINEKANNRGKQLQKKRKRWERLN